MRMRKILVKTPGRSNNDEDVEARMSNAAKMKILMVGAIALFSATLGAAHAVPLSGWQGSKVDRDTSIVEKMHGFHCRAELGWDPRAGIFRRHSHRGICEDYKRCLEVHHRCIFVLGRGIDSWRYERWGEDNWRYTSCMLDRGCY